MASLDGYSLNEKIDNLRKEVGEDLIQLQKAFANLYEYIKQLELKGDPKKGCCNKPKDTKKKATNVKQKKGAKNA